MTLEKRNSSSYRTAAYSGQRLTTDTTGGVTLKYLYDAYGNLSCTVLASWASNTCPAASTGQTVASELVTDNVYDYRDRLVAVRSYTSGTAADKTEYRYDPLSRPIRKTATEAGSTTTTEMVYLGIADAVVRETETGATTKDRTYAFDALGTRASLSETISGTANRVSYVYDPHSSVELLLDQANGIKAAYGYTAYGDTNNALTKTAAGFNANTNLYRYTGKRWDPAAKAYDMGARHYSPSLGRWFQQDAYSNAIDSLDLSSDPLTQNRYAFAGSNPVGFVESDGHRPVDLDGRSAKSSRTVSVDARSSTPSGAPSCAPYKGCEAPKPPGYGVDMPAVETDDLDYILIGGAVTKTVAKKSFKIVARVVSGLMAKKVAKKAVTTTTIDVAARIEAIATEESLKGIVYLADHMSPAAQAKFWTAYKSNPYHPLALKMLGHAVHDATAAAVKAQFGSRIVYNRNAAADFMDAFTGEAIELTTKTQWAKKVAAGKYGGKIVHRSIYPWPTK